MSSSNNQRPSIFRLIFPPCRGIDQPPFPLFSSCILKYSISPAVILSSSPSWANTRCRPTAPLLTLTLSTQTNPMMKMKMKEKNGSIMESGARQRCDGSASNRFSNRKGICCLRDSSLIGNLRGKDLMVSLTNTRSTVSRLLYVFHPCPLKPFFFTRLPQASQCYRGKEGVGRQRGCHQINFDTH